MNVAGLARDPSFLGPYRLIGTLGEGGMGVVHLALDPLGRAVAVKVLRPQVAGDGVGRRRLGREVASLRRVRHPNVAEVLDADLDGPAPYVVTAFVPARTLEHHVRQHGPLPAPYVAHLGRVLISALRAIHAAGVVHRDVKPANVLLLDDAPVLIDFGIAHVVDESRITMSGLIMGTPGYLPPELVEGQSITPATDWWAWGATLAYAATGRAPFGTGPAAVVLDRVRRGEADLDGVDPRIARVLAMALNVNPLWRGTGDMLLAGLAPIEPWRPGARPFAPALTPDQVRTVPLATVPGAPAGPPPPGAR
ncbi:MAG: serine/threonine-protein kinase, partial [Kineosporiaceae bacterium]